MVSLVTFLWSVTALAAGQRARRTKLANRLPQVCQPFSLGEGLLGAIPCLHYNCMEPSLPRDLARCVSKEGLHAILSTPRPLLPVPTAPDTVFPSRGLTLCPAPDRGRDRPGFRRRTGSVRPHRPLFLDRPLNLVGLPLPGAGRRQVLSPSRGERGGVPGLVVPAQRLGHGGLLPSPRQVARDRSVPLGDAGGSAPGTHGSPGVAVV